MTLSQKGGKRCRRLSVWISGRVLSECVRNPRLCPQYIGRKVRETENIMPLKFHRFASYYLSWTFKHIHMHIYMYTDTYIHIDTGMYTYTMLMSTHINKQRHTDIYNSCT